MASVKYEGEKEKEVEMTIKEKDQPLSAANILVTPDAIKVPLDGAGAYVCYPYSDGLGGDQEKKGLDAPVILPMSMMMDRDMYDPPPPCSSVSSSSSSSSASSTCSSDDEEDKEEGKKAVDKYDVSQIVVPDDSIPWKDMNKKQRVKQVLTITFGVCFALGLLYIFICSLDLLTSSFQLLAGRVAAEAMTNSVILNNPVAGLMIGVLATVLLQSSSTSTSIVVAMVGSGVMTVEQSIYIIMGANIGTSVTNSIVSMSQSTDIDTFRRSFAGATVHDMFNWLTVVILLPLEAGTGYLYLLSGAIVKTMDIQEVEDSEFEEPQFLKVITQPLTDKIVKVDKSVVTAIAEEAEKQKYPLCKYYCSTKYDQFSQVYPCGEVNETFVDMIYEDQFTLGMNLTNCTGMANETQTFYWEDVNHEASALCTHQFVGCGVEDTWCNLSDQELGGILFVCSLFVLLTSVIIMVKILNLVLKGPMAKAIRIGVNAKLPGKAAWLTGYLAILMGAGITMLLQSSSVFTSTLTPLVGMGLISVERMYPLTLGSNIGTTLTSVMAALTASGEAIRNTMQVSMCHLFFNITGIIIFYPIPFMRKLPLSAAKFLGDTTANYRWFAIAYILMLFLVMPVAIFGLSLAGWQVMVGVLVPIAAVVIFIVVIKCMQNYCQPKLPEVLQNWHFLPLACRSLEPYDKVVKTICFNKKCQKCCKCCECCQQVAATSSERSKQNSEDVTEVHIVSNASMATIVNNEYTPEMPSSVGFNNGALTEDEIFAEAKM